VTDLTRDEILRDIILAMAERGFTFVRTEEGDTRSDEPRRQDKATADPEWIRGWTGVGLWLASVAKRQTGFVIDIDDMDACVTMVENGILVEVCEMPGDGERKKGRKTPFVILHGELK